MIVRISTEGQYELADDLMGELDRLDNQTVHAVESGDESAFASAFADLVGFVRDRGQLLGASDLRQSEIILPPPDTTLEHARDDFGGEGVVPDLPA